MPRPQRSGAYNHNVYTRQISGNPNLPWCAAFVSVKLKEAGITGFSSSGCADLASQFRAKGKYFPSGAKTPQPGDVIFFNKPENHTGIVVKVDGNKVYTTEGNKGDQVKMQEYDLSNPSISGYGRPIDQEVSSDLGFDVSSATPGGSLGRPSGRSQGPGSASRSTSTGLDGGVYPSAYSHKSMLQLLLAILRGDAIGMLAALQELLPPPISNEDLTMLVGAIGENPEIASKLLADPEGTLEALKMAGSPEEVAALAAAPMAKASPSEASQRLVKDVGSTDLEPAARGRFEKALESVPQAPRPRGWQPPEK